MGGFSRSDSFQKTYIKLSISEGLSLYGTTGEPGNELFLQEEKQDHHRGDGDEGAGHDQTEVVVVEPLEIEDGHGKLVQLGRLQHDLWRDEIIPNADEDDDQVGADHGPHDRQDDLEEDPEFTAAIDPGGFDDIVGQAVDHGLPE